MMANPAAQCHAQAEVDSVTAGGHVPGFDDLDAMPYVTALVWEVFRWKNVGPIAVPHFIEVEDEYMGFRIPAQSIILGNAWAILHNESVYPNPDNFEPERFLANLENTPFPEVAFGFGRRLCPGRHMAFSAIWIAVVRILAAFNIKKPVNKETGEEIDPSYEYVSGFIK
ncbi:cytochrome P450 [Favolaschia claudopus]|uniref:Cytochrome P450 n=1 Tax=Favolaschia claudopus TaxID=2862362 RepID=A0AAW0A8R1_9AGAR